MSEYFPRQAKMKLKLMDMQLNVPLDDYNSARFIDPVQFLSILLAFAAILHYKIVEISPFRDAEGNCICHGFIYSQR